jgi:hypothetical protein
VRVNLNTLITEIKDMVDYGEYTDAQILKWINLVEGRVMSEVFKMYERQEITVTSDTLTYDLTAGYNSNDVVEIFIDKERITKYDLREMYNSYFTDNTVNDDATTNDSTLVFQTGDDVTVILIYQKKHTPYLIGDITTTYLLVEHPYNNVYENYVYAQMAKFDKEYNDYSNLLNEYNNSWDELVNWYEERSPVNVANVISEEW